MTRRTDRGEVAEARSVKVWLNSLLLSQANQAVCISPFLNVGEILYYCLEESL